MAELTRDERLALVVRAEVARLRADQATWRSAQAERRVKPYVDAVECFEHIHGRDHDSESMTDLAEVIAIGGEAAAAVDVEAFQAAAMASFEAGLLHDEAARAMQAVVDAARAGGVGDNILEWAGVDVDTLNRAVKGALGEG
jgi:hypothetical protein